MDSDAKYITIQICQQTVVRLCEIACEQEETWKLVAHTKSALQKSESSLSDK